MRELKFRAYVKHLRMYVRVVEINFYTEEVTAWLISPEEGDPHIFKFDSVVLEQFTGLHDSKRTKEFPNGQEIYEVIGNIYPEPK